MDWKDLRIVFLLVFGLIILWRAIDFWNYEEDYYSVTFWVVLIGTIFLLLLLIPKVNYFVLEWLFGDISSLKCDTLTQYYSKVIDTIGLLITSFIVGLSILWGLSKNIEYGELHKQTFLAGLFLIFAVVALISTLGRSLKNQIKIECKKGEEESKK